MILKDLVELSKNIGSVFTFGLIFDLKIWVKIRPYFKISRTNGRTTKPSTFSESAQKVTSASMIKLSLTKVTLSFFLQNKAFPDDSLSQFRSNLISFG